MERMETDAKQKQNTTGKQELRLSMGREMCTLVSDNVTNT
jgi:hypothetical protein